jgi:hypothetical protein
MPEDRLPLRLVPSAKEKAQQAYDDALEAFDTPREALEGVAGYIKRMKQGRRALAYDHRWRGARDQGREEYSDEELLGLIREAIGEEGPLGDALRFRAQDRRRGAQDQPLDYGPQPTTGSLTHEPAGSRSANAGATDSALTVGSLAPYNKRWGSGWLGRLG